MAGVNYISGFLVGAAYYTGAEYGGNGTIQVSAVAPPAMAGLSLANDLAMQNNLPVGSCVPQAFLTLDSVDYGDTGGDNAVAASCVLTATDVATAAQTVTIGTGNNARVYTWVVTPAAPYDVAIGANLAASMANLRDAINRGATEGTDYGLYTVAHPDVTATADGTHVTVTARIPGIAGNNIATTDTSSNMSWASATLTGGLAAVPS